MSLSSIRGEPDSTPYWMCVHPARRIQTRRSSSTAFTRDWQSHSRSIFCSMSILQKSTTRFLWTVNVSSRTETYTTPCRSRSRRTSSTMLAADRNRRPRPQKSGEEQKVQAAGQPRDVMMNSN